jgi:hypothetical protein
VDPSSPEAVCQNKQLLLDTRVLLAAAVPSPHCFSEVRVPLVPLPACRSACGSWHGLVWCGAVCWNRGRTRSDCAHVRARDAQIQEAVGLKLQKKHLVRFVRSEMFETAYETLKKQLDVEGMKANMSHVGACVRRPRAATAHGGHR